MMDEDTEQPLLVVDNQESHSAPGYVGEDSGEPAPEDTLGCRANEADAPLTILLANTEGHGGCCVPGLCALCGEQGLPADGTFHGA